MEPVIKIKKTHAGALLPARATEGAAAYDLSAALDSPVDIPPGQTALISTGIAIELPSPETVALVFSRSGIGIRNGIGLINAVGVIDSDYRGTIQLGLINHSKQPFTVKSGDRIAQLVVMGVVPLPVVEVEELSDTPRGAGGLGSTGI